MNDGVWRLSPMVVWTGLVWFGLEAGLLVATGYSAGAGQLALTGGCAVATVVSIHIRRASFVLVPIPERDRQPR